MYVCNYHEKAAKMNECNERLQAIDQTSLVVLETRKKQQTSNKLFGSRQAL